MGSPLVDVLSIEGFTQKLPDANGIFPISWRYTLLEPQEFLDKEIFRRDKIDFPAKSDLFVSSVELCTRVLLLQVRNPKIDFQAGGVME